MLPTVHVLLPFSSVKHIIQCKCWKNRGALGVIFGTCIVPSITLYFHCIINNNYLNLDENNIKNNPAMPLKKKRKKARKQQGAVHLQHVYDMFLVVGLIFPSLEFDFN